MADDINEYLACVHRHTPATAVIAISTMIGQTKPHHYFYQRQHFNRLIADVTAIGDRLNVYCRITPLAKPPLKGRGLEADAMGTSVLWVDYDSYTDPIAGLRK